MEMDYEIPRELKDASFPHNLTLIALAASDLNVIFYQTSELLSQTLSDIALLALKDHNLEVNESFEDTLMFLATFRASQNVNFEASKVAHYKRRLRLLFLDMPGSLDWQRGLASWFWF